MRKLLVTFLLSILILSACTAAPTEVPARPTATPMPRRPLPTGAELELTDPARVIEVVAGEDFTITVETDRPADYHWEVAEELDANIVAYVWKDHIPEDPGKSSGRDVWRFIAVAPGETTITLGYYQGLTDQTAKKPVFTVVVK